MKRIIVLLVLIVSVSVYADCDKKELARLKKIAENVEINYITDIKEKKKNDKLLYKYGEYTLNATNINSDIKVRVYQDYYSNIYKEFKVDNGIGILEPFYDGEKVTVTIEAHTNNGCSGERLATKTISLPYYNAYSESKKCDKENIFYNTICCNKILEKKYSNNEIFNKCLDDYYRNEYLPSVMLREEVEEDSFNSSSSSYIIYVVIVVLVISIIITCILLSRKIKKNRI